MRTIIITGGGSGIGRATAQTCARRGDVVVVLDKHLERAEETAESCRAFGAVAAAVACDVSDELAVGAAFQESFSRFGPAWGLFANAGIDVGGRIHELPVQTWTHVLATNLTGVFLTCKIALQQMVQGGVKGSIVCTSSPCAEVALPVGGVGAYSASKGGISSLVRCMALDYARHGIRVNAVVPGATETNMMWNNLPRHEIETMRARLNQEIPLGRLAQPEDVARAVVWLLSDESAYITGSHLVCDGGVLAKASISI